MKDFDRSIAALEASVAPLAEQEEAIAQQVEECKKACREAEAAVQAKITELEALRVSWMMKAGRGGGGCGF